MAKSNEYSSNDTFNITATVPVGQTTSGAIDLSGVDICGVFVPANFDGTTITFQAASLSPQQEAQGIDISALTYLDVQDGDGANFTLTTAAGKYVPIKNLAIIAGLRFVKLICGATQAGTDTVFTLSARVL